MTEDKFDIMSIWRIKLKIALPKFSFFFLQVCYSSSNLYSPGVGVGVFPYRYRVWFFRLSIIEKDITFAPVKIGFTVRSLDRVTESYQLKLKCVYG